MSVVKTLNKNATVKQQTSADLPSNPVKYITQRGSQTSTDGQTVINLGFAVDLNIKDAFLLIIDGKVLLEGSGNDYTFTSVQANNTSAQVTLTQSLTAGLNIIYILMGALVQTEPSINTLAATVANLSGGSGQGGINYIAAPDAEKTAAGWNRFQDAAAATPTDGTGTLTANNITFTQNTTTPLRGTADFKITKDAVNRQGEGVSYDFTIDRADRAKPLTITFDYSGSGVTWATSTASIGDIQVWIYDVDAAQLIQPAAYTLDGSKRFKGVFQTSATSLNYRLIFFIGGTTATSWTFNFDNVRLGPDYALLGCPVTDWQSFSMVIGATTTAPTLGTNTSSAQWRRVGDSMEIVYTLAMTGAGSAGSGTYLFTLPPGYQIDTSKATISTTGNGAGGTIVGIARAAETTASNTADTAFGNVIPYSATQLAIYDNAGTTAAQTALSSSHYSIGFAPTYLTFRACVPILGWGSTTQMSNDTDTRIVSLIATNGGNTTVSTLNPFIFQTVAYDSHSAYNSSTGRYTCPVPGVYDVAFNCFASSGLAQGNAMYLYKNGVQYSCIGVSGANANAWGSGSVYCNAGDIIDVRPNTSATGVQTASFAINRRSGPSAIAATETVAASYELTGTVSPTQNIDNTVIWNNKIIDTHGAMNTSTGLFTAPAAGIYEVFAQTSYNPAASGGYYLTKVLKNGSQVRASEIPSNANTNISTVVVGYLARLNAGDTIAITVQPSGLNASLVGGSPAGAGNTAVIIKRVGT